MSEDGSRTSDCVTFDRVWYWRKKLSERKGQRCRIIAFGAMNSCQVEFEDGINVITSRFAVRKASPRNGKSQQKTGG